MYHLEHMNGKETSQTVLTVAALLFFGFDFAVAAIFFSYIGYEWYENKYVNLNEDGFSFF